MANASTALTGGTALTAEFPNPNSLDGTCSKPIETAGERTLNAIRAKKVLRLIPSFEPAFQSGKFICDEIGRSKDDQKLASNLQLRILGATCNHEIMKVRIASTAPLA